MKTTRLWRVKYVDTSMALISYRKIKNFVALIMVIWLGACHNLLDVIIYIHIIICLPIYYTLSTAVISWVLIKRHIEIERHWLQMIRRMVLVLNCKSKMHSQAKQKPLKIQITQYKFQFELISSETRMKRSPETET